MTVAKTYQSDTIANSVTHKNFLKIKWEDGYESEFYYLWLRDNCPSTPRVNCQRTTDPLDLPPQPYPQTVRINEEYHIEIVWANEDTISTFEPTWLKHYSITEQTPKKSTQQKLWGAEKADSIIKADYHEILENEAKLKDWLLAVRDEGIALLQNVPTEPEKILEVASHFGCIRETYWGKYVDIKSIDNPESDAFTNLRILPHTDLSYFAHPPAYLLFHYLTVASQGGSNILVDGFKIAEVLRREAPEKFKILSTLPVQFRFQHTDADLIGESAIFSLDYYGNIKSIRFSSRAIQPFNFPSEMIKPYYEAYRTFLEVCNQDEYKMCVKFNEGDLLILDNHRVLHGRTGYEGKRFMQSAFIERTELMSRLSVLNRKSKHL